MKMTVARALPWIGILFAWSCAATVPGAGTYRSAPAPAGKAPAAADPAQAPEGPALPKKVYRERIEWINVWIPDAQTNDRPRVLLIGDSITQGYYGGVAKRLSGKAYVGRLTTSLSVCDPKFLDVLKPILESFRYAVIQFNNGIHGKDYPLEAYRKGLDRTFRFLREKARGAKIVWAATTPAKFKPANQKRNDQIRARNHVALELCRKYKILVNDLYALSKDLDSLHRDDFHYKAKAIQAQAQAVARFLAPLLPKKAR